jgi:hypothetical protein
MDIVITICLCLVMTAIPIQATTLVTMELARYNEDFWLNLTVVRE